MSVPARGAPMDDPVIWHRCMELRDAHWSLRKIAQQLLAEYDVFDREPSPTSVARWAELGREQWEKVAGTGTPFDALDAAKVRPVKVRRLHRLMAKLDQAVEADDGRKVLMVAKQIEAQAVLERLEAQTVGTDAPKRLQVEQGPPPAVDPRTAGAIEATPAPTPLRWSS